MIKFPLGSPMPGMVRIVGVILQIVGLYATLFTSVFGIIFLAIGCFATYQFQGVDVDTIRGKFRFYRNFMGIKTGDWLELAEFRYISLIKRKTGQRVYGMSMASYNTEKEFYSIILMNTSHRSKYVLKNVKGAKEAMNNAQEIAQQLELELVKYSPQVSSKTRRRR